MLVNEILTNVAPPVRATVGLVRAGMVPCQCARSGGGNGRRPYDRQTQDIIGNIKNLLGNVEDVTDVQIVCDISPAPEFLHKTIYSV